MRIWLKLCLIITIFITNILFVNTLSNNNGISKEIKQDLAEATIKKLEIKKNSVFDDFSKSEKINKKDLENNGLDFKINTLKNSRSSLYDSFTNKQLLNFDTTESSILNNLSSTEETNFESIIPVITENMLSSITDEITTTESAASQTIEYSTTEIVTETETTDGIINEEMITSESTTKAITENIIFNFPRTENPKFSENTESITETENLENATRETSEETTIFSATTETYTPNYVILTTNTIKKYENLETNSRDNLTFFHYDFQNPQASDYKNNKTSETSSEGTEGTKTTTSSTTTTSNLETTPPTTTTKEPDPCIGDAEVQNLKIIPSKFSITLNWTNPFPQCNFTYLITWKTKLNEIDSNNTSETNFQIENLNACESYIISICVIYENKLKTNKTLTATTREISGAVDINHEYFEKENQLIIFWDVTQKEITNCIKNYRLKIFHDEKLNTHIILPANNFTLLDINGCIKNTYIVSALSTLYEGPSNSTTFLDPKINDPPIFNSTEIFEDYVVIKWTFGKFICRPETFLVKYYKNKSKNMTVQGTFNVQKNELSAKIDKILPHVTYYFCGLIINAKGSSECSNFENFLTKSKAPEQPVNLKVNQIANDYLNIEWNAPKNWNGVEESYNVSIEFVTLNYNSSEGCKSSFFDPMEEVLNATETEYKFYTLIPASKYKISVAAKSDGGWGQEIITEFDLKSDSPEKPDTVDYMFLNSSDNKIYNTDLNVTWNTPCKINGVPKGYHIELRGSREGQEDDFRIIRASPSFSQYNIYIFKSLKPDFKYSVYIQTLNEGNVSGITEKSFTTSAGIPQISSTDKLLKPNSSSLTEPWKTTRVYLRNDIFNESMGRILYYSIIVAVKNCEEGPKNDYYDPDNWPEIFSDNSSCANETRPYDATKIRWNPFTLDIIGNTYEYILGQNDSCSCNKPLDPNTEYSVKIRGFTNNGYCDTELMAFKTGNLSNDVPVGLIVGLIIGILAIAFILAGVLFYTRGKLNFKNWPRMESTKQTSPAPVPVSIKKFGLHFEEMIENPGKIKNEFQLLSTISSDVTLSTKTALLPTNKKKNRYINILPYDQTRVKLNDINADYINASYIMGYSGSTEYIATQGPTEATCPIFWQMILEQNIKLVVMLTQFVESGKDKCYKYFPELKEEYEFLNDIKVQCIEEELLEVYNRRIFKLIKGNVAKKVVHVQFNLWPDFGVPEDEQNMIDFCEIVKEIKLKKPTIIVMHCSAGVGRTGTLIAFDILLHSIRDKRKVDIFGTVLNLRKQRMTMVQSEKQYEFLYKCIYYVITHMSNVYQKQHLNQISESNML